jgi:hypothetical protein
MFSDGAPALGTLALMLGALTFGALTSTLGLSAPQPSHPKSNGINSSPRSQPQPGGRR